MRIVGGGWRGRTLAAPPGQGTRPTADRVRQAVFDMLMHAEWGGRGVIEGAMVLDVFAGTGALGLEALSRGAASACFIENDAAALKALRANVAACGAEGRVEIVAGDALTIPPLSRRAHTGDAPPAVPNAARCTIRGGEGGGGPASLVFLDPPYGLDLIPRAIVRLRAAGRIAPAALIVAEAGRDEVWVPPEQEKLLAERRHGAARILIFRPSP
jgi:16S rRNA (guanine966-N2)-methyltransferase